MSSLARRAVLPVLKHAGMFALARYLTRRGLRVLCYHGIALGDEHQFNPLLFMTPEAFRDRLARLKRLGHPVISLHDAVRGDYPDAATVITFDDGWSGTLLAADMLAEHDFPSTLYVTTYYVQTGTQVFNVLVHYLAWKSAKRLDLKKWDLSAGSLADPEFMNQVLSAGERLNWRLRQELADELCHAAGVPEATRLFRLMSMADLRRVTECGMNVQLHTHRHRFRPDDTMGNKKELNENRMILAAVATGPLEHFCYPSGNYSRAQFATLAEENIMTAVTTEGGFNFADTPAFAMTRFLDGQSIPGILFEAELCGVPELARSPRSLWSRHRRFRACPGFPDAVRG
jgi:peptidoglycan/xylan/chitin deacetylase (PgdA/CDA1 family)